MAQPSSVLDGFFLPASLQHLTRGAEWEVRHVAAGRAVAPGSGVAVRWPRFTPAQWEALLRELRAARGPQVPDLVARWQRALAAIQQLLASESDYLQAVADYTGYPLSMLGLAFAQGELVHLEALASALGASPTWAAARSWQPMLGGLPGQLHFYPARHSDRWTAALHTQEPLYRPLPPAALALGIAAGNVPGNGLLAALLLHVANHTALGADAPLPPGVLVRLSRQAPLLEPWVMAAIERADPELVQGLALLVWDYEDEELQRTLLGQADLALAAASDETIATLDGQIRATGRPLRFLRHGHKVSFSAIGRAALHDDPTVPARLAALDSTFWDQYGCLSARVHFVEHGSRHSVADYAAALRDAMRELSRRLERGQSPRRFLHQAYDTYKLLEPLGNVQVMTSYDDDCLVVVDQRPWNAQQWRATVNRCTGRVVVVRPVDDVGAVPGEYLRQLPAANLQSMSIALEAGQALKLAGAAGACGVTALRSLGRAAFPQLAYSWDGLLPLDMGNSRPAGHFTTLETADPLGELAPTLARLGLV